MWPRNVGIKAIEIYFPAQFVEQTDLEVYDGVSKGKYTLGLGQSRMSFCDDREDVNSLCLSVFQRLLDRHNIKPKDIGHLGVGTETLLDKSKSVKSVLMQLLEPFNCTDIEGVDSTNACYGGTAALFNALAWVESSAWDGRFAVVVAADNAVYAPGSARPTGGAGAVAMLIGPDAPLVIDQGLRASCFRNAYDFYKPNFRSEYPVVDGQLSIQCYLSALDECYRGYRVKAAKLGKKDVGLGHFDAFLFHSPYCKLVQKSFARLDFMDFLESKDADKGRWAQDLSRFKELKPEETYFDKDVEKTFMKLSESGFEKKTKPSLYVASLVGNMYTPSVYCGLVSLLVNKNIEELAGNKIGIFSYGSGLTSTMYSLTVTKDVGPDSDLRKLVSKLSYVKQQLSQRKKMTPEEYSRVLDDREKNCHAVPFQPRGSVDHMFPGTFYLTQVDEMYRRTYERTPPLIS